MPPTYPTSCPIDGRPLTAVTDKSPETAPWLCQRDARGWWPAELTAEARALFRPQFRDFGSSDEAQLVWLATLVNRDDARARGTSRLPEHPTPPTPPRGAADGDS